MCIELKIKSKHLALEPGIIKFEERKLLERNGFPNTKYNQLRWHRCWDVRNESRATHLARTFLAGKPYNSAEAKRSNNAMFEAYIVPRIVVMVNKYGTNKVSKDDVIEWANKI